MIQGQEPRKSYHAPAEPEVIGTIDQAENASEDFNNPYDSGVSPVEYASGR
jgi:hypothetical protein